MDTLILALALLCMLCLLNVGSALKIDFKRGGRPPVMHAAQKAVLTDGDAIPAVVAKNLAICGTLLLLPFQGCDAAIPTIQEYSIGTGTIIKNKNVEEAPVKAEAVEISSRKDLQKLMSDLLKSFDKLENQINQQVFDKICWGQAWDDLRVDLARGGGAAGGRRLGAAARKSRPPAAARLGMTAPGLMTLMRREVKC
ncbi:unnamed protein product [Heterosigma akashiwo]